jgi:serine/threonine protein kinase
MVSDAEGQAAATASMDQSAFAHMEKMLRDETAGEYVVGKMLGRGGMAVVYLAEETRLGRKVALKVLPPELTFGHGVDRFLREAKTAATLDHPHIIPIYRIASGGKLFWYAMKYLEGTSLDDVLKERGAYSLEETIVLLEQVADALDYAHEHHVIHRDIKPANVMLDNRNRVIITDFGIAKALTEGALTASGSVIGTPYYMSPEQGMGKPVAGAADQYSVAVMAFRMLSGHLPFDGDSAIDILHKHCMMDPPLLSESMPHLPEHVVAAVEKAMAKKAPERFPNIKEFVKAMKDPSVKISRPSARTVLIDSGEVQKANAAGLKARAKAQNASAAATMVASPPGGNAVIAPKSRTMLWVTIAVLALGGGGAGTFALMKAGIIGGGTPTQIATDPGANPPPTTDGATNPNGSTTGNATNPNGAPTGNPTTPNTAPPPVTTPPQQQTQAPPPSTRRPQSSTQTQSAPTQSTPAPVQSPPPATTPTNTPSTAPAGASAMATLRLALTPPGIVSIDGVDKGEKRQLQEEIRPGTHVISVRKDGYAPIDTTVTFTAGKTETIRLTLTPRP